jgi:hypothetical protein
MYEAIGDDTVQATSQCAISFLLNQSLNDAVSHSNASYSGVVVVLIGPSSHQVMVSSMNAIDVVTRNTSIAQSFFNGCRNGRIGVETATHLRIDIFQGLWKHDKF